MKLILQWIFFLVAFIFCAFPNRPAFAAACSATTTIDAAAVTQLAWPTLAVPAGAVTYKVDGLGGADSGSGLKIYGTSARGQYTISKRSGSEGGCTTIDIDITSIVPGNANLTFSNWTGSYAGIPLVGAPPWTGLTPLPGAGQTLFLGATANYTAAIPIGALVPTFNISIQYDAKGYGALPQTAAISFDSQITIDTVVNANFGVVLASTAANYTINTAGTVTAAGGGVWYGGTTNAGSLKIHGSSSQTLTISTGSYVAGGIGNGVVPSAATCSYNGGAATACDAGLTLQVAPTAAGKTLLLGVKVTVDANQTAGTTATPSFTVTVTYT